MQHNYTRQRQERVGVRGLPEFDSLLEEINYPKNAELSVEGNYNNIDGILGNSHRTVLAPPKDDYAEKTLLEQVEYGRAVSARNAVPIDGREPDGIAPEKAR